MSPAVKNTRRQRRKQACFTCRRRKLKCDKKQPCSRCTERDMGHLCFFESSPKTSAKDDFPNTVPQGNSNQSFIPEEKKSNEHFRLHRQGVLVRLLKEKTENEPGVYNPVFPMYLLPEFQNTDSCFALLPPLHIFHKMVDLYLERFEVIFRIVDKDSVRNALQFLTEESFNPGLMDLVLCVICATVQTGDLPTVVQNYLSSSYESSQAYARQLKDRIEDLNNYTKNLGHCPDAYYLEAFIVQAHLSFLLRSPRSLNMDICNAVFYANTFYAHNILEGNKYAQKRFTRQWVALCQLDIVSSVFLDTPLWIQHHLNGQFCLNKEECAYEEVYLYQQLLAQILQTAFQLIQDQHLLEISEFSEKLEDYNVTLSRLSLQVENRLGMTASCAESFRYGIFKLLLLILKTRLYKYYPFADGVKEGRFNNYIQTLGSLCLKEADYIALLQEDSIAYGWHIVLFAHAMSAIGYTPFCKIHGYQITSEPLKCLTKFMAYLDRHAHPKDAQLTKITKNYFKYISNALNVKEDNSITEDQTCELNTTTPSSASIFNFFDGLFF
ncbi:hypothetical protein SJAG_02956 [Schizosaccharomyces japonicus yFS275]|uniref:Zn(2)-C6 fungal-type domain-containing protein n=1 Tax=Schizosaccharomyces japonicus (strain yFS275 / FY16936) TaxID=402676 RepID=B6K2Y1_SCHJY|nr:hypothetical protein SJAG_02956 [Schizosaccharomyces japonicus yFS275]EEB07838.2 hypothetical protein SJAG_02956 [Schizosaccharomyces japonicus yFS275]